jgi:hypothetical protein
VSALKYGNVTKGLIIREPWISMILEGWKTWEMRTKATSIRGPIALIRGGSGTVVGVADLVDSLAPLTESDMRSSELMHGIGVDKIPQVVGDGWVVPWVLQNAVAIAPVPYTHPSGAVTWVNLAPEVTQAIAARAGYPWQHTTPTKETMPAQALPVTAVQSPVAAVFAAAGTRQNVVLVPITGGNIRNGHIHLRHVPDGFFPAAIYGGSNKAAAAKQSVKVKYNPGPTVVTDIAGDKLLFRDRAGPRAFFDASGAKEGDKAQIERRLDGSYVVSLVRC